MDDQEDACMSTETGEVLTKRLEHNLANMLTSSELDLQVETEALLHDLGASTGESGGHLSFYGSDPIVPSTIRFGSAAAIALAAKAIQIASVWRQRTGEGQDIEVDVRKALRRFSPFIDRKWETVNGYDGGKYSDPANPVSGQMYETKDGRWVMPENPYPELHRRTTALLNVPSTPGAVKNAVKGWNGEDLERAGVDAGIVMPLARPLRQIMGMDIYRDGLRDMPLIRVEKISASEPRPFEEGGEAPLSGLRALGLAHVVAGPAIGRAMALHGADVLNIWNPNDWEHNVFSYTSHVGMRSATLQLSDGDGYARFIKLLGEADVFFSNRRPHYLARFDLDAETLCNQYPGLIHTRIVYATEDGPWRERVGFDVSTGFACGIHCLEGTDEKPEAPPIFVVNDYIAGWLATIGTLEALKRRASEGGSYRVVVSLSRVTMWLMSLGILDKRFAQSVAGSSQEHTYVAPDQFTAQTPMGIYTGVTEQVRMSRTPGGYRRVLEPRGSAQALWLQSCSGEDR